MFVTWDCVFTRGCPEIGRPRHAASGVPAALSGFFGVWGRGLVFCPEASGLEREKIKDGRPSGGKAFGQVRLIGRA